MSQNGYGMAEDPFSRKASHLHKATIGEPEGFVSPEGNETGRKFVDVRDSGGPGGPMDPDPAPQREPRGGHINPRERGGGHPGSPAKLTTITKQTVIVRSMWASESNSCFVMVLSPWATVCLMGRP